jgi:glucosamine-6-phosphate deaminase
MKILVKKNYREVSLCAAMKVAELVRSRPAAVLGLATGKTPLGTYRHLIRLHTEGLDFSRVRTFNLDEYLGIGLDLDKSYARDQSYARFMYEEFFKHVNIPQKNIYIPDGLTKDPEKHCRWYEAQIKKEGGIDLQILGIGRVGHWAFNEPGSSLDSRTRVQPLAVETQDDNYKKFYKNAGIPREEMPHFAITMGVGTILESRAILMIGTGAEKSAIVAQALEGPVTTDVTASSIQIFKGEAVVILDRKAASRLSGFRDHPGRE